MASKAMAGATKSSKEPSVGRDATPADLINFFHLCRIVLEDIPDVLRTVFKDKISDKYKQNWVDGPKCGKWLLQHERFQSRLNGQQKQLLGSGKTSDWDVTLLVHALLYSSEFLFADPFHGNQVVLHHSDPYKIVSSAQVQADFTRHLRARNIVLCDLGNELARNEVKYVTRRDVTLKYPIKSQNPSQFTVYICSRYWVAVEALSFLRNTQFAHCKNARIDVASLKQVVQSVKAHYKDLRISGQRINDMTGILNETYGDEALFRRIEYYQDKWHEESTNYFQVKEEVDHLHSDVDEMRSTLISVKKDTEIHDDHLMKQQEAIKGLQTGIAETNEEVLEIKNSQKEMKEDASVVSTHLKSLESRQSSLEQKEAADITEMQQKQDDIDSRVSDTVKLLKEVSWEQKDTEERVSTLEETKRQMSEEIQKTGDLVHQLSVKDDEKQEQLKDLKDDVGEMKLEIVKAKEEIDLIQHKGPSTKLSVSHFESDISYHSEKCHAGTRQWLFDDVASWKKRVLSNRNQPNMCLISANPGMGKSVLAAKLCATYKLEGNLAGCFFFQHHLGRRSNPKMLVQTLCYQFQSTIEGYSILIEDELTKIDLEASTTFELFSYLIKEPLSRLSSPPNSMMVVIDALDECDYDCRPDLLKVLIRDFIKLPRWIQIILTTRPDKKILQSLKRLKSIIEILPEDSRNLDDIRLFLHDFLVVKMSKEEFHSGVELLVEKSEGMFLYFHYAIDALEDKEHISLEELKNLLPDGIDDYYEHNFRRLFDSLGQNQYQIFLQGILMARSDFPQNLVGPLLGITNEEAKKIVSMVSTLLPVHNGSICIFHKSVRDWLLDKELAGDYAIDPGHKHLAALCQEELKKLKAKFSSLSFNELCKSSEHQFVVQNVVHHLSQSSMLSNILKVIEDIRFMYLRLIYNHGATSGLLDDINESLALSSKEPRRVHQALMDCYNFIRRHSHVLDGSPSLIFQCALNEPRMFSERLGISQFLPDPLRAFPGLKVILEVVNKPDQFVSPHVTFSSGDNITSCALLPQSNVLIFSDFRGFVYFCDIQTCEVLNKVDLSDEFKFPYSINTCSVSADRKMIAYGNLKQALNFEGEKVPLVKAEVKHEINSCIFSPNGDKILSFVYYQDGMFRLFEEIQLPLNIDFHIELWDIPTSTSQTLHIVKRQKCRPMCTCFAPDGKKIFCGYRNGAIIQWNTNTCVASAYLISPEIIIRDEMAATDFEVLEGSNSAVFSIVLSQNGHFMAASTGDGLQIWDAAALEFIAVHQPVIQGSRYTVCSFSQDSCHLVAGTANGYLEVFVIEDFTVKLTASVKPDGSSDPISECLFTDPSNVLCAVGNNIRIYDLEALIHNSHSEGKGSVAVHPGVANSSIILPQDKLAVTLGKKQLCLWDVKKCQLVSRGTGTVGGYLLRVSADGKTLLTYGDRCYIEVWDVLSLMKMHDLVHLKQKNLPIGRDEPDESSPSDICHCSVSVDGIVVGGTGNGDLFVWHGEKLQQVKELDFHESLITFTEFSPSGSCFVSADMDGAMMMWKLSNKKGADFQANMNPLTGHDDSIEQICYSRHGRRIVSCSMDKCVHLYNGASGDLITKLTSHKGGVMRVEFSYNEATIVSGDDQGEIILWDGMTGQLLQHIKPRVAKIIHDLQFVKQGEYICSRDSNADYITVNEVCTGKEVSRLSFTTEIFSMSASSLWKQDSSLLCCLKDGSVKFVRLLDSDSIHVG